MIERNCYISPPAAATIKAEATVLALPPATGGGAWDAWHRTAIAAHLLGEPVPPAPTAPDPGPVDPNRVLTASQAAGWLDTIPAAVGRWRRSGRLPAALDEVGTPVTDVDGRPMFRLRDVLALAESLAERNGSKRLAPAPDPSDSREVPEFGDELAIALFGYPWRKISRYRRGVCREWLAQHPDWRPGQPVIDETDNNRR